MQIDIFNNATNAAVRFSGYFGYELNKEAILQHPYFPSLLSLSEVLEQDAGIKNFAAKITPEQLSLVLFPCIAHLNSKGGEYAIIHGFESNQVVFELNGRRKKLFIEEFSKIWSGAVLVSEQERKVLYKKNLLKLTPLFVLVTFTIALFFIWVQNSVKVSFIDVTAFTGELIFLLGGLYISMLLLIQSIGRPSNLLSQLCGSDSIESCNNIINSKIANITSWLTFSELGFLYFSGNIILLMLSQNILAVIMIIIFNLVALPFTFWSIYYQWKIAKVWCKICLALQGLFWCQAFFTLFIFFTTPLVFESAKPSTIPFLFLIFVFPLIIWLTLKPLLKNFQQLSFLKFELNRFKFNPDSFSTLLKKQRKLIGLMPKGTIILGATASNLEIVMVSNPFCNPCAEAHRYLGEWLTNGVDLKLNIVFAYSMNKKDKKKDFFNHLINLSKENDKSVEAVLKNWYDKEEQNFDHWIAANPTADNTDNEECLSDQVNWCRINEIKATPTFFINGYKMPEDYNLKSLKYIVTNLNS